MLVLLGRWRLVKCRYWGALLCLSWLHSKVLFEVFPTERL